MTKRENFLIHMYDQLFNDINRHIIVVWQSVGVLVGAFAIFALIEKQVVSLDIASAIILLLSGWLIAHLYDASYWYNRILAMIANIEKQFLETKDLKEIHYYFGSHRPKNKMIRHLSIQFVMGIGLGVIVIFYHFIERVVPGLGSPITNFDPIRSIPYVLIVLITIYLYLLRRESNRKYEEFLKNSPGMDVDTTGITYGEGHGHE